MESREVVVSIEEMINADRESFLDLLEELFFAGSRDDEDCFQVLENISYRVIGGSDKDIRLLVSGYVEEI